MLARRLASAGAFVARPAAPALEQGDLTVVVPVHDRPEQLDRLLGALHELDCVVVDDASTDAVACRATAERHSARYLRLASNAGPAAARNAGFALARTPLVAFVDSDCVPPQAWLRPLLGHFEDPLVAAVAPRIVPRGTPPEGALARYEAVMSSLDRGPHAGLVRQGNPIPFVPTAALVVRADVVPDAGLFDVSLRGGEDVDLVWRLNDAGWDVHYEPGSTVEHDGPATLESLLTRRAFYGTTAADLSRRHPGALAPAQVSGWSLAVWSLVLARRPLLALATLATSVGILATRLDGLVRDPVSVAARVAGGGTARSALPSLRNLVRAWSPVLLAALAFRRTRRIAASALLLSALSDWARNRQALDPVRFTALHLADDAAYGAGVWTGCRTGAHHRAAAPPRVVAVSHLVPRDAAPPAGGPRLVRAWIIGSGGFWPGRAKGDSTARVERPRDPSRGRPLTSQAG